MKSPLARTSTLKRCLIGACLLPVLAGELAMAADAVGGQQAQEPVVVRVVRFETLGGGVERPTGGPMTRELQLLPEKFYTVKDGVYHSVMNRIALRVPRVGDEKLVDVREAVAMARADGSPATTHLVFDPGGISVGNNPTRAVSAVVVTRLRDDRPKDAESVIESIDGGHERRASFAGQGITYAQADTKMGPALRRIVRNRAHTLRFPYDTALLKDGDAVTYGVTIYVVVGTDSMVEFSQLFPCGDRDDASCRAAAIETHEAFFSGVTAFRRYLPPGDTPTSAPR